MGSLTDRIAERTQARVEALAFDIADRGFVAAEEYARSAFQAADGPMAELRKNCAIALVEHIPGDLAIETPAVEAILRQHCADAFGSGESLSSALRAFAARAILAAPKKVGKGRPTAASAWQRVVAYQIIRDLKDAGVPVYHGDGADTEAEFYATDAVAAALGVKERTSASGLSVSARRQSGCRPLPLSMIMLGGVSSRARLRAISPLSKAVGLSFGGSLSP